MAFSFLKKSTKKKTVSKPQAKTPVKQRKAITKSAKLDQIYGQYKVFPYVNPKRTKRELDAMANDPYSTFLVSKSMMRYLGKTDLLRGDVIALWWIINPHIKKDPIPEYFERRYGINLKKELIKLTKEGYLSKDHQITDQGKDILKKYANIIEFHQSHNVNMTEREWANFQKQRQSDFESHNDYLRKMGQEKEADANESYHQREMQNRKNLQAIVHAKVLENEGELKKAEKILLSIDPKTSNSPARLYQRIAINFRKQKDYTSEIKYIKEFLSNYEPTARWRQIFTERLATASKLQNKKN